MEHRNYNRKVYHAAKSEDLIISDALFEDMWQIFVHICKFWRNLDQPENYKQEFLAFVNNRISLDPSYVYEYQNASEIVKELIYEYGDVDKAYEVLFTDKSAIDDPPSTLLGRARHKVSNEFIVFQLSVGGFKFAGATNSLGYISGANIKGKTPYRTI